MINRRSTFMMFAAAILAPLAAHAQVGGLSSSTAPSNSEGTPSGGTGVIGQTQVQPTLVSHRHRRRRHHRHHRAYH